MNRVYYNEFNPYCAQWLRNLIAAGELPEGDVDERDIRDVQPEDVKGYTQCHFFAGIGGWPLAFRLAGWPDDEPVWSSSLPCQPFSSAGKRKGKADERHLWPDFRRLVDGCAPRTILGEQVASKDGLRDWYLSGVLPDLEARGYECGALDLPAACLGAPHIRQRLWWVAQSRRESAGRGLCRPRESTPASGASSELGGSGRVDQRLGDASSERREGLGLLLQPGESRQTDADVDRTGEGLEYTSRDGRDARGTKSGEWRAVSGRVTGSPWSDYDLVWCLEPDGSLVPRRLKSGLAPLVDGATFELADGRSRTDVAEGGEILKAIGNGLVIPLAVEFIHAAREAIGMTDLRAPRLDTKGDR